MWPFFSRIRKKEKWNILKRNQRFISMFSAIDSVARDLTPLVADLFFRSAIIVFLASRDIASLLYTIYSSHLYFSRRVQTHVYVPCALYSILFHCCCIFECFDGEKKRGRQWWRFYWDTLGNLCQFWICESEINYIL